MSIENQYQTPASNVDGASNSGEYSQPKFFAVSGRLGRLRFIAYNIILSLVSGMAMFLILMIGGGIAAITGSGGGNEAAAMMGGGVMMILMFVMYIVLIVLSVLLMIQRCHDFNMSGWLSLIVVIPFAAFAFWFVPGTDGANDYGNKTPPNGGGVIALVVVGGTMLVFAIIGILAAIAIPAYNGYIEAAKQAVQIEQQQ